MKRKTKTQEKSGLPSIAQLKKEVAYNYLHTERFLIKLTPECFIEELSSPIGIEELSSPIGFGAQDLKQPYFDLYTYLLGKYKQKLIVKLVGPMCISLYAKV